MNDDGFAVPVVKGGVSLVMGLVMAGAFGRVFGVIEAVVAGAVTTLALIGLARERERR